MQKKFKLYIKHYYAFLDLKQNIDAQQCMHVKNHHHETKKIYFECWIFFNLSHAHFVCGR